MSVDHPPQEDFALYVMGALEPRDCELLEQHVRVCTQCADLLAAEARLEVKLHTIIANIDEMDPPRKPETPQPSLPAPVVFSSSRSAMMAPALVLLAASVALIFGLGRVVAPPNGRLSDSLPYTPQELSTPPFSEEASQPPASPIEPQLMMCSRQVKVSRAAPSELCALPNGDVDEAGACDGHPDGDPPFTPISAVCLEPR